MCAIAPDLELLTPLVALDPLLHFGNDVVLVRGSARSCSRTAGINNVRALLGCKVDREQLPMREVHELGRAALHGVAARPAVWVQQLVRAKHRRQSIRHQAIAHIDSERR